MLTDPQTLAIRDFRAEDAGQVVALWRASFEHGVGIVDHHPIEAQRAALEREVVPRHGVRVATVPDGAIVAFIASTPETVAQLYVRVDCLRRGIGSRLLRLAQSESSGSLWLYTFARNADARRFYERHGFVEVERESQNMWKIEAIKYVWTRDPRAITTERPARAPARRSAGRRAAPSSAAAGRR